jgi:predicted TIM-barrel fold metal-dependent hydrolase
MTYANGRVIHDADSHVMEPREWLEPFVDAEFAGKLQPVLGERPGRLDELVEKAKQRRSDPAADAAAAEHPIAGPKGWIAYGGFDPGERKKVMDDFGFASQLVFPTAGLGPMRAARDEATKYAAARAYNRAIAAFCAEDRRLIPVAYTPLDNVALALASAREALADGCGAVMFSNAAPGDKSPGHPDFDPFWQLLCERDVPFLLHIGQGTLTQPQAFRNNGRERAPDLHGGGENLRFCDYPMLWVAPQIFLTALVYDGVLMRFPKLRGGVIESAAGWVPEFLRALDIGLRSFGRTDPYLQALDMKPSEYLRRAIKFTPFPSEDVGRMIRDGGSELFMFSSDYPHPEGTTDPLGRFERSLQGLDETVKEKFYRTNYEALMGPRALALSASA